MNCRIYIANDVRSNDSVTAIGCGSRETKKEVECCPVTSQTSFTWVSSTGRKGQRAERREKTREMHARVAMC